MDILTLLGGDELLCCAIGILKVKKMQKRKQKIATQIKELFYKVLK